MQVRVRDRHGEAWGHGPTTILVRTFCIADTCPKCGGPRGEPRNMNQVDDGCFYSVDVWDNPCGHIDRYVDVIAEANGLYGMPPCLLLA